MYSAIAFVKDDQSKNIETYSKTIDVSSSINYTKKFELVKEMIFPVNKAMSLSNTQQSRYPRTYLKINEIFTNYSIKGSTFLDIGAEPGAFSLYMLSRNYKGIGISIENKKVKERIRGDLMKKYYDSDSYRMIQKDFFDTSVDDVADVYDVVDVITCDIARGTNNRNKWDSHDPGLSLDLDDLLKSSDLNKMSDYEYHIRVLDRCIMFYEKLNAKFLVVKMFNINDYGLTTKNKKPTRLEDRLFLYLKDRKDVYFAKPLSSPAINNEYYIVISRDEIKEMPVETYDSYIGKLLTEKIRNIEKIKSFVENFSIDVIRNSTSTMIRSKATEYLGMYGLMHSFEDDLKIQKKKKKRIVF